MYSLTKYSKGTLEWFRSYLSEEIFLVSIKSKLSDFGKISFWVPLFLIYVNNMPQAVNLYADDSCIFYQHKEVDEMEKHLNKGFENIFDWFLYNKSYFTSTTKGELFKMSHLRHRLRLFCFIEKLCSVLEISKFLYF